MHKSSKKIICLFVKRILRKIPVELLTESVNDDILFPVVTGYSIYVSLAAEKIQSHFYHSLSVVSANNKSCC